MLEQAEHQPAPPILEREALAVVAVAVIVMDVGAVAVAILVVEEP